jgi:hypothetical protein
LKIQDFVGVQPNLTQKCFQIPKDKSAPCFIHNGKHDCLAEEKGRSFEVNFEPDVTKGKVLSNHLKTLYL